MKENEIKTIAFPCLGMGAYRVPMDIGTKISIDTALEYEKDFEEIEVIKDLAGIDRVIVGRLK